MARVKVGLIQVRQRGEDGYERRCEILLSHARACFEEGADIVRVGRRLFLHDAP